MKGVSEVVGSLLMLVVITLTVSVLIVYGTPVIESSQSYIRMRNVEAMMVSTNEIISKAASDVMPVVTARFSLSGGSLSVLSDNSLTVYINNSTSNLYSTTLVPGKIEYVYSNKKVCLENGGVWEKDGSSQPYVVFPPHIRVRGENVSIAIYKLVGNSSVSGRGFAEVEIRYNSSETRIFNESGYVEMNITSDYARAWKDYLEKNGFENNGTRLNFSTLTLSVYVVDVRLRV